MEGKRFYHISTDGVWSLGAEGLFTEITAYDPNSRILPRSKFRSFCVPMAKPMIYLMTNCSNNYGHYFSKNWFRCLLIFKINLYPFMGMGNIRVVVVEDVPLPLIWFYEGKPWYNIEVSMNGKIDWVQLLCKIMDEKLGRKREPQNNYHLCQKTVGAWFTVCGCRARSIQN
jgi:dTDP-glucose 4,6-dehydratase